MSSKTYKKGRSKLDDDVCSIFLQFWHSSNDPSNYKPDFRFTRKSRIIIFAKFLRILDNYINFTQGQFNFRHCLKITSKNDFNKLRSNWSLTFNRSRGFRPFSLILHIFSRINIFFIYIYSKYWHQTLIFTSI